jgi:hypothetical protein
MRTKDGMDLIQGHLHYECGNINMSYDKKLNRYGFTYSLHATIITLCFTGKYNSWFTTITYVIQSWWHSEAMTQCTCKYRHDKLFHVTCLSLNSDTSWYIHSHIYGCAATCKWNVGGTCEWSESFVLGDMQNIRNFFFICIGGGWVQTGSSRHVGHLLAYCTCPGWLWGWRIWWNEWQGKRKYSEKTCPGATLSITNPTWPEPGLNPGHCGGKPVTNCFSYGTAKNIRKFMNERLQFLGSHDATDDENDELLSTIIIPLG